MTTSSSSDIIACEEIIDADARDASSCYARLERAEHCFQTARRSLGHARVTLAAAVWQWIIRRRSDTLALSTTLSATSAVSRRKEPSRPSSRAVYRAVQAELLRRRQPDSSTVDEDDDKERSERPPLRIEILKLVSARCSCAVFFAYTRVMCCRRHVLSVTERRVTAIRLARMLHRTLTTWSRRLQGRLSRRATQLAVLDRWHVAVQRGSAARYAVARYADSLRKRVHFRRLSLLVRAFTTWLRRAARKRAEITARIRCPEPYFVPRDDTTLRRDAYYQWKRRFVLRTGPRHITKRRHRKTVECCFGCWHRKTADTESRRQIAGADVGLQAALQRRRHKGIHRGYDWVELSPHRLVAADAVRLLSLKAHSWTVWSRRLKQRYGMLWHRRKTLTYLFAQWRGRAIAQNRDGCLIASVWRRWWWRFLCRCKADTAQVHRDDRLTRLALSRWTEAVAARHFFRVTLARRTIRKWSTRTANRSIVRICLAAVKRRQPLSLRAVFVAWRRVADRHARFKSKVRALIRGVTRRLLRAHLVAWRAATRQIRAKRCVNESVCFISRRSLLEKAWRQWMHRRQHSVKGRSTRGPHPISVNLPFRLPAPKSARSPSTRRTQPGRLPTPKRPLRPTPLHHKTT